MKQCKHFLLTIAVLLCSISVNAQIVASGSCGDNLTWTLSEQGELTIMGVGEMYNYLSLEETPWYDKRGSISRIFIKEGVTSIGDNAFAHCYLLRSITIPEGLTIIGTDAFADVNGLQTVFNYSSIKEVIGGSKPKILNINELVNIDKFLFYTEEGTHYLAGYIGEDTDIIFPSDYNGDSYLLNDYVFQHPDYITSVTITKGVEKISALTLAGCSNLTSIVVVDENTKYDSREDCNAVIETNSNTLILGCSTTFIPNSVTSIDSYAFYECRNITSIVIPKTITEISNGAIFFGCNSLTSIVVEDGNTRYDSRNNCNAIIETNSNTLIAGCSTTIIPEDIESIGTNAFFGRGSLTSIEIPENVAVLGWWSFAFCDNLTSIVIPSSVTSLSNSVFWNCCSLTSITCNMELPYPIDYYAFAGVDKSIPVYVPASSVEAYKSAKYWSDFTNIQAIPSNDIASGTCGDNLTWKLTEDYELIIEGTGAMYEYYYGEAPWYEYHDIIENVVLLEGVISIGRNAFINCGNLIDIIIPKSVVSIETQALATCNSLISIVVHEENPIYDSRDNCNAIIETKSNTLIAGCNNTTIPQSVTSIGRYAFAGCCNINTITIPEKVKYIEDYAFNYCDNLVSITIPAGVVNIGKGILSYCRKLESIIVNEENPAYDSRNDCNAIIDKESNALIAGCATTVIPEDVVSIGESAFAYHMITDITIPKEVTNIGNLAFSGCSKLSSITLYAETPPLLGGGVFDFIDLSIPIYVPYTSISAYKSSIWGVFTNIRPLFNEYSLAVSAAGYATLFLDYNAKIPEDVEVYIASSVEGDRLMMTEVEGVLPANTGVIVCAKAGTYTFVESEETPANVEGNLLTGTTTSTYITAAPGYKYYVLAQKDGVVGMYRPKLTDGQFLNNANKAYLALKVGDLGFYDDEVNTEEEQLSNRLRFDFGGTTDIERTTDDGQQTTVIYDLQGRRVAHSTKGINIVKMKDGSTHKVLVK